MHLLIPSPPTRTSARAPQTCAKLPKSFGLAVWCRASGSGQLSGTWRNATACAEQSATTDKVSASMSAARPGTSTHSYTRYETKRHCWRASTASSVNPRRLSCPTRLFALPQAQRPAYVPVSFRTQQAALNASRKFPIHSANATATHLPTAPIAAHGYPSSKAFPMTAPARQCGRLRYVRHAVPSMKVPLIAASTPSRLPATVAARARGWNAPTVRRLPRTPSPPWMRPMRSAHCSSAARSSPSKAWVVFSSPAMPLMKMR